MLEKKVKVPQWIPTAILILLVPVVGYLVVSNIESTRNAQNFGAENQADAELIAFMHQKYDSGLPRHGYHWLIGRRDAITTYVCYCDKGGYGLWYAVKKAPDGTYQSDKVADTSKSTPTP